ncbi:hypothetical protein T4D_3522 [Trichinella pseudospiralis]|nr:hypothetical protein T4D_3522 [Trichinella pseudospiralis]
MSPSRIGQGQFVSSAAGKGTCFSVCPLSTRLSICPSVFHCAPSDRKRETRCAWRFSSDGPRPLCNDQCHFPSGRSTLTLDVAPATPDRPIIAVITKLVSSGHDRMRKRP